MYDVCCGFSLFQRNTGMVGGNSPAQPPGVNPAFQYLDYIDDFGANQYVAGTSQGAFFTNDITTGAGVTWTQIGAASTPAGGFVGLMAAVSGTPSFFAINGTGNTDAPNGLWRFDGTGAGNWQQLDTNILNSQGVGIFAVDATDPNRLYASSFNNTVPSGGS